jgi:hypothetical protein
VRVGFYNEFSQNGVATSFHPTALSAGLSAEPVKVE